MLSATTAAVVVGIRCTVCTNAHLCDCQRVNFKISYATCDATLNVQFKSNNAQQQWRQQQREWQTKRYYIIIICGCATTTTTEYVVVDWYDKWILLFGRSLALGSIRWRRGTFPMFRVWKLNIIFTYHCTDRHTYHPSTQPFLTCEAPKCMMCVILDQQIVDYVFLFHFFVDLSSLYIFNLYF